MAQYLLSVVTPSDDTAPPTPDELDAIMARVGRLQADQQAHGVWVFSGGLAAPATATTLRPGGSAGARCCWSTGRSRRAKEYLGGFTVIDVADLDAALDWGRRTVAAIGLPIEVRPFAG